MGQIETELCRHCLAEESSSLWTEFKRLAVEPRGQALMYFVQTIQTSE